MTKAFVDDLVKNMKSAGMVAKALPWMVEGFGDKQLNTRYIGLTIKEEWNDIFSSNNNILLKFIIGRSEASIEFYLANKPPFLYLYRTRFTQLDKWEVLLGEFKRKLRRDKLDFVAHKDAIGNLYTLIQPHLK